MGKLFFIFISLIFLSVRSLAYCESQKWPFSRKLTVPQLKLTLDRQPKDKIVSYLISELKMPPINHLATPLLSYLIQSESNKFDRGFYKTLGMVAFGEKVNLSKDLDKWPTRRPIKKSDKTTKEICILFDKYKSSVKRK